MIRTLAAVLFTVSLVVSASAEMMGSRDVTVIDGDTVEANGKRYRLVGCDAPETRQAKCDQERRLGEKSAARLQGIINKGAVDLTEVRCSCFPWQLGVRCNRGRKCGVLSVDGKNVCDTLIAEDLARAFVCGKFTCPKREGWCP